MADEVKPRFPKVSAIEHSFQTRCIGIAGKKVLFPRVKQDKMGPFLQDVSIC